MNPLRKLIIGGAIAASTFGGGTVGALLLSGRATAQTTTTTPAAAAPAPTQGPRPDPSRGGHMANGVTEALLTGETANQAKAAAETAVPGGTVQRVENDAEGATYEAHITKADGSQVTVKMDSGFKVLSIDARMR